MVQHIHKQNILYLYLTKSIDGGTNFDPFIVAQVLDVD